jgi:endoglucanase
MATGNLIQNGDFATGVLAPWWTTNTITPTVSGGALAAQVSAPGPNPWDAIVGQNGIGVVVGSTYTLSFKARARQPSKSVKIG